LHTSFIRISLLSIALITLSNTAIAGGSINGRSLMDDYLQNKASVGSDFVVSLTTNNALVFNQRMFLAVVHSLSFCCLSH
jgi:hypothetical protein